MLNSRFLLMLCILAALQAKRKAMYGKSTVHGFILHGELFLVLSGR